DRRPAAAELHVRLRDLAAAEPEHQAGQRRRAEQLRRPVRPDAVTPGPRQGRPHRMAHELTATETATDRGAPHAPGPAAPRGRYDVPPVDAARLDELAAPTPWAPRPDRRGSREKFAAGLRGLKHAIRGDSSYFAHAYRGTLIALTAALLSVDALGWCLLVI